MVGNMRESSNSTQEVWAYKRKKEFLLKTFRTIFVSQIRHKWIISYMKVNEMYLYMGWEEPG
jgi:hypothetical protein